MAQALPVRQETRYEEPAPPSASDTVTVACNMPTGMTLYLQREVEISEAAFGGTKTRMEWRNFGEPVHIKGPRRRLPSDDPGSPLADSFMLTFGVPREFMELWFKQNPDLPAVQERSIVMRDKVSDIKAITKENAERLTGLEPLKTDSKGALIDKRVPRGITKLTGN